MNVCIVELTTVPADEHAGQRGFAVRVEISHDDSGRPSAEYWRGATHAMQWMELQNEPAVRVGPSTQLTEEVAASLWNLIRSTSIGVAVEGQYAYLHATRFQLTVSSWFFSCNLSWFAEPPPEWRSLVNIVQVLESIGNEAAPD